MKKKLIIASHNHGKIKEFKSMFANLPLQVESLVDYPEIGEIEETGTTFEENARLKAETIAKQLNCLAIADDSGLCVPALKGEPGVYSARYSGVAKPNQDQANIEKLLREMSGFTGSERDAYFVSCIVVASPDKESLVVEGRVDGQITDSVKGHDGFGYDPLFLYPEDGMTFAQMSLDRKNQISHRARAVARLKEKFPSWLEEA